jgi:uncharacterized protein YbcI
MALSNPWEPTGASLRLLSVVFYLLQKSKQLEFRFHAWYYFALIVKKRMTPVASWRGDSLPPMLPLGNGAPFEVAMKSQGEIEAAICEGISHFEQHYMGRGPKDIQTHLIGDLLVVRLKGVLTAAEQQLVKSLSADKGRDLLKQVRTHLIETARPVMEAMVHEVTGVKSVSLHHDISTATGEEVVLFTLAQSPLFRDIKRK